MHICFNLFFFSSFDSFIEKCPSSNCGRFMRYTLGLGVGRWRQCTGHRAVSAPGATAMVLHLNPRLESGQLDQLDQLDRAQQLTLSPPRSKAGHLQQPAEPGHSDLRISIDLGPCLSTSSPSPPAPPPASSTPARSRRRGRAGAALWVCWHSSWRQMDIPI